MKYLPKTLRLVRKGLTVYLEGMPEDWRNGYSIMDFHATLGRYELEDELADTLVRAFNSFMELHNSRSK